jgi:two-component system CheB/CheR fusion protein
LTKIGEERSQSGTDPAGPSAPSDFVIVGMGASAGGLEACTALLSGLPEKPGFAIVVIVHLDPDHESVMAKLLDRSCRLPVVPASEGCQVRENHVYVVPPAMRLSLNGGVIRMGPLDSRDRGKPIDLFFSSLAVDQGHRAIGVVLSGNGSDGTLGLRAIKDRGGLTLVQDPESASCDGMPRSALAKAPVDRCLSLVEMAAFLVRYASGLGRLDGRASEAELESFRLQVCHVLKRELHHDFSSYKKSSLLRRVHRRMLVAGVDTLEAYASILDQDVAEARSLLRELLVSVTQFFRDPSAFEALAPVIGRLIEGMNDSDEKLRIWVPACATGEEAYSLAMLVVEQFERVGKPVSAQIFATEIDQEALSKARSGRYPESIAGEVSESRLRRFFTLGSGGYQVSKTLRAMCLFTQHNVTSDPPFSRIDLVSCRNLLIYLDTPLQNRVLSIFHYALKPQGVLFLGAAETLGENRKLFAMVDKSQRIFEAQECSKRPPSLSFSLSPLPSLAPAAPGSWSNPGLEPLSALSRFLLPRLGITVLVLDDQDRVKDSYGHPDRYLSIRPGPMDDFLFALVRKTWSSPLRLALLQSRRDQSEVLVVDETLAVDGVAKRLEIRVFPARLLGDIRSDDWLLCFQETGLSVAADLGPVDPFLGTSSTLVQRLEDELESTRHLGPPLTSLKPTTKSCGRLTKSWSP